jgi:rhamnosyltransferase
LIPATAIHAVVVCYHPDVAALQRMTRDLLAAGARVVLVDNTPGGGLGASVAAPPFASPDCAILEMGRNTGIAHAQNAGIRHALDAGAQAVAFFDQDSQLDATFLARLTAPLVPGQPAIVAPKIVDEALGTELPSTRLSARGLPTPAYCGDRDALLPVDVVIASGSAATREVFELAGVMEDGLFIDSVDTEWCLRCRAHGVPIHVVPGAVLRHRIGQSSTRIAGTTVLLHAPTRCYYQIRNSFLLFKRAHVPFLFALREALSVAWSRLLLLTVVDDKTAYIRAGLSGLVDGLRGVTGERPGAAPSLPASSPPR